VLAKIVTAVPAVEVAEILVVTLVALNRISFILL